MTSDQTFRFKVGDYHIEFTVKGNNVFKSIEVKVEW